MERKRRINLHFCLHFWLPVSVIFLMLLLVQTVSASQPDQTVKQPRRVVILHSGPLDFPATQLTESGIREAFFENTAFHVQLYSEYLDLSRFRDPKQRRALADLLRQRYAESGIDLVIGVDVPAAEFLLENVEHVFPRIPIVLCSIPRTLAWRFETSPLRDRMAVAFEPINAGDIVGTALALRPATRHAVLISGTFDNDRARSIEMRKALESLGSRIQIIDLTGFAFENVVKQVKELPRDSVIFFTTLFVDGMGRSFIPRDVVQILSDTAAVPIFGPYDSYMGNGIVGGRLVSLMLQGRKAGEMAGLILGGMSPSAIPLENCADTCVVVYDWRQLTRWKIGQKDLQAEARVLFREPSLWDLYKFYFLGIFLLLSLESLLIVTLGINLQKHKHAEVALRESRQDREIQTA
jgi:ABC-type uncharacterized transport system substrate-binding protein